MENKAEVLILVVMDMGFWLPDHNRNGTRYYSLNPCCNGYGFLTSIKQEFGPVLVES